MKIYHYNQETHEYVGDGLADADPLVSGNWLIPAHATNVSPPAVQEGKTIHFENGSWVYRDIPNPEPEPDPEPPTPEQIRDSIVRDTQRRLDQFANTRGYDGILSLCTYATSTVPKFASEGQYGVEARDATWANLYEVLAEVEDGTRPMPAGYADIEPELPVLAWPI